MTVGILGAGQLGRMLALAGYPLGLDFLFLDKEAGTPAAQLAPSLVGSFTDPALLDELARRSSVVTVDWENVPLAALQHIEAHTRIAAFGRAGHSPRPLARKGLVQGPAHTDQRACCGRQSGRLACGYRQHRPARRAEDAAFRL